MGNTGKIAFIKTSDQTAAVKLMGSDALHILLFGGARSGKTFIILRQMVLRATKAAKSRHCVLRKHFTDLKKAVVYDTFPKVMEICFPGVPYHLNMADYFVRFPNGSEIWFGGLDKGDKILGNEYATIFFNEISEMLYEQIETAYSRLAQKCPDIVNKCYYDCNPPGKSHWSYKLFVQGLNPQDNGVLSTPESYVHMQLNPEGNKANLQSGYLNLLENLSLRKKQRFLFGNWTDDAENALWKRGTMINPFRMQKAPEGLERIVVAVDPAVTNKENSDATGIVIAGVKKGHYYVLDDRTIVGSPLEWAATVINAYNEYMADRVVAEVNQGGDMVEATLRNVDRKVSYRGVRASRGKVVRAEPIAALYEKGLVHHVGTFPLLEDEMCSYTGEDNEDSPDRMDALVWALTDLSERASGSRAILV